METINLWDNNFTHLTCSIHGKTAKKIQYSRNNTTWSGITIFTDSKIFDGSVDKVTSTKKVAWLMEPPAISPSNYTSIHSVISKFDALITCDSTLLSQYPDKTYIAPAGGVWVEDWKEYKLGEPGLKLISIIYSDKNLTEGHKLRPTMAKNAYVEKYGTGPNNPIDKKEEGLSKYLFSLAIENSKIDNYFSEKLLDCFATSTIPVYWGCPNISNFFNPDGMLLLDDPNSFDIEVLNRDCGKIYQEKEAAIRENYEKAKAFEVTDDWIYDNILVKL